MALTPHVDFLTAYALDHFTGDPSRDNMLRLKLDHSLRVLSNAEQILTGENINGRVRELGQLAALYHDTGRFPQFAEYATFDDNKSVNHGRMGVLALRELSLPGDTSAEDWRVVRQAVGQHNVKTIRPTLPEPLGTITKLVRDADKIDILKIMVDHFSGDNPKAVITHDHPDIPGHYSNDIYDSVMARNPGDYRNLQCVNDFKLLIVGWIYDLNFTTSVELVNERGLISSIISFLPKDEKIQLLEKKVNNFMHYKN